MTNEMSAESSNSSYLISTNDGNSYRQHTFGLYWKEGASDGQNQQSSLSSLSFQDLNLLYNNQWSTQVLYSFYIQNVTSLANDTPINGFIEPSCSGLNNEELQLINESYSEINN
ncbi:hypothetical protein C2G38_2175725 [Gigaspora rosea]|uniref:Uncharacterized protein n=1 Tax=Gigaspora rosea TaxID=44941 RepID=A0A397VIU1_9GLOM|nr:hypothetical protein C2G38_2175725 [Gigaspora rosea]